jgi:hypothetical protein
MGKFAPSYKQDFGVKSCRAGQKPLPLAQRSGGGLVWASNRSGKAPHEINIFVADWIAQIFAKEPHSDEEAQNRFAKNPPWTPRRRIRSHPNFRCPG